MKQKLIHIDLDVEVDDTQYHGSALAKDGGESLGVPAGSISAVQAQQNYSLLYWQDKQQSKDYLLRQQISDLERQLEGANIVRCHRSWLVNWQKVQGVTGIAQGYAVAVVFLSHITNNIDSGNENWS